jgi:hypothetical protein
VNTMPLAAVPITTPAKHRRGIEAFTKACLDCAATERPQTLAEMTTLTGYDGKYLLGHAVCFPWLRIIPHHPPRGRLSPLRYLLVVDRQLKDVFDAAVPVKVLGKRSIYEHLVSVRKEITRRRAVARAKRAAKQWNPDTINTLELTELINYVENELDKLIPYKETT